MANAISRLQTAIGTWSFKYNCYETVHPWTPYCSDSALEVGLIVFSEAIKLYSPLYLFSQLAQRKFDHDSFKHSFQSIIRSTTFISANAFFALLFFCSTQHLFGKFYYYAVAWMPGFLASSMAVMIEKPNRRSSLAFYVANVASETLFRIYVAKGYMRPIPNGQVYLFTLSMATILCLAKKHGFDDDPLSAAIKLIVGPEEAGRRPRRFKRQQQKLIATENELDRQHSIDCEGEHSAIRTNDDNDHKEEREKKEGQSDLMRTSGGEEDLIKLRKSSEFPNSLKSSNTTKLERLEFLYNWLKFILTAKNKSCPHYDRNQPCLSYSLAASGRAFALGFLAQLGLKVVSKVPSVLFAPNGGASKLNQTVDILRDSIRLDGSSLKMGLFLSSFTGLYKLTNCFLRWLNEGRKSETVGVDSNETKSLNCFLSALVAGPSFLLYPSPTIALYVLWKCLEALFNEAVEMNLIKNKNLFIILLYGLATNQLFYSALMDPKYMKKSYMAFLHRMSRHKLHLVNRSLLDVFGTEASAGYEDFFPDLHPKFMSKAFLGTIWIWMLEQKYVQAKQVV